uniref:ATP synthase F0 subunit 8 n=1 Tax=Protaeolidiella atra TaxID=1154746 RepID=A0A7S7AAU7_9GAST|nr:ATP synthase F0 subunit 8 [Protaeolidiella atra]QOW38674.1 ATP synthase F0 subunit 8 [Protaeolidiella atra]
MPQLSPMMGFLFMIVVLMLLLTFLASISVPTPKVQSSEIKQSTDTPYLIF